MGVYGSLNFYFIYKLYILVNKIYKISKSAVSTIFPLKLQSTWNRERPPPSLPQHTHYTHPLQHGKALSREQQFSAFNGNTMRMRSVWRKLKNHTYLCNMIMHAKKILGWLRGCLFILTMLSKNIMLNILITHPSPSIVLRMTFSQLAVYEKILYSEWVGGLLTGDHWPKP